MGRRLDSNNGASAIATSVSEEIEKLERPSKLKTTEFDAEEQAGNGHW